MARKRLVGTIVGVLALVVGSGVAYASSREWKARPMVGANEVPANASASEARAQFELEDGVIKYKLRMRAPIEDAFMAHIHVGPAGANGPIVVWLFGTPPATANPAIDFEKGDVVGRGEIDAGDLVGPLAGKSLADLMALLDNGGAYVNLHTRAFPGGEVRAQVTVSD